MITRVLGGADACFGFVCGIENEYSLSGSNDGENLVTVTFGKRECVEISFVDCAMND